MGDSLETNLVLALLVEYIANAKPWRSLKARPVAVRRLILTPPQQTTMG